MKFIISLLLSMFAMSFCFSQSSQDDGKWEIGLNVLPLFDSSFYVVRSSSTGFHTIGSFANYLLLRYRIGETIKLRSNLGLTFYNVRGRPPGDRPYAFLVVFSDFGAYFSIGMEKYVETGMLSVYFSGSLSGHYFRSIFKDELDTRPDAIPPTIYKIRDFYSEKQFGVDALAGVNIKVIPRLFLSVESRLLLGYRKSINDYKQHEGETLILTAFGGGTRKRYIADLLPISAAQIIYQF